MSGPPYQRQQYRRSSAPPSLWREAWDTDGTPYWYHIETKETTWQRPVERFRSPDAPPLRRDYDNRSSPKRGPPSSTGRRSRPPPIRQHAQPRSTLSTPRQASAPATLARQKSHPETSRRRSFVPQSQRVETPSRTPSVPSPSSTMSRQPSVQRRPSSLSTPTSAKPDASTSTEKTSDDFKQLLTRLYDARKAAATTFAADLELLVVDTRLEVLDYRLEKLDAALQG
eukprot:TRINITY_DN5079_c0_g1_i1.p1 TRINITY_DN5079_c0_g1~~TRINITY_DN5079_c0_g1_i1.p1  ORF type:complete len:227 (+),score=32.85 TRINITY_DN5079_c0_g1_i1:146-826(+)